MVTVEWQEVAQAEELNPIQLNVVEQSYLLQPHRFQGQIYDIETGLHYNRFRYYDPNAGRFISHDPIGLLGGDNHFQYAPNPVGWTDAFGLAKSKKPGGYEIHDVDGHGRLSPQKNRKIGNCNIEDDDFIQSHHPVQQEWGKLQTFPNEKYSPTKAPAILLPSKSGMSHATISSMQRKFRRSNGYNTTARQEMMEAAKQLRIAGVPQKAARKALSRTYKYLDSLGAFK